MTSGRDHGAPANDLTAGRLLRGAAEANRTLGPVGALLFDLCNVLFDDTLWSRRLFQLVSRMGHHVAYDDFWDVWQRDFQPSVARGRCAAPEALQAFLRGFGLSRGQIDEAVAAMQTRCQQLDETVRPLPGVKLGLAQLHASGWTLGVLGHVGWGADEIRRCLERMGVASSVDAVLSVRDLASEQPEASPYILSARALRAAPEQTVFVSANRYHLAEAAQRGLQTVSVQLSAVVGQRAAIEQIGDLVRVLRPAKLQSVA